MRDVYFTDEGAFERTWNSESMAHRQEIMKILAGLQPWQTLLEVGCHVGVNMKMITAQYPEATVHGMDTSAIALDFARSKGLTVSPGALSTWTHYGYDIILSSYVMCYVSPYWLRDIMRRMVDGAQKAIILAEPMVDEEPAEESTFLNFKLGWTHPYFETMHDLGPGVLTRIPIGPVGALNGIVVWEKTS